jgi:choline-sulfatase
MKSAALVLAALLRILTGTIHAVDKPAANPNVLHIAIDDLNDWVGCLGGHPDTHTPNIDRLAKRGMLFTNAHCQAPICNPSRTSFMTGMRPSTTGIYVNSPWFRATETNKDRVSMTEHFAAHGYETLTAGKIYHGSRVDPKSFQVLGPRPGQINKKAKRIVANTGSRSRAWDFGPQTYEDAAFHDHVVATWATEQLAKKRDKPFFLTVGFYRPHVPLYAPQRLFDALPRDQVELPQTSDEDREDLPPSAIALTNNPLPPAHEWFKQDDHWPFAVQAYLASTRFTDEQVGRVMAALDAGPHAKNTIVVLLSDHGFHLGEKQRWAKQSLWERSTRVPLIISVPGGVRGKTCTRPAELINLFPTLIELCDVEARKELEGVSMTALLKNPKAPWDRPAITTYQRSNHAVRSERWRYIRYADGAEELYDHWNDPHEWKNQAADPALAPVLESHRKWLPTKNAPEAVSTVKRRQKR